MTSMPHSPHDYYYIRPVVQTGHDVSWYGTLGLLAACVSLLLAAGLVG